MPLAETKSNRPSRLIGLLLCLISLDVPSARGEGHPIARIPPGTTFDVSAGETSQQDRWNQVILLAKPRISGGDTDKLGETIRSAVSALSLTILATVSREDNGTHRLTEVGVGYSVPIEGKQTIVSAATVWQLGANLGLIARHVLNENEKQLPSVHVITRSSTLFIFDTPAIMHRDGEHRDYTIRHLCWINPSTGKGATLVWLLEQAPKGGMNVVDEPMRVVATGTIEDREIHVDGAEFLLGIPSKRAFALESLPPGLSVRWPTDDATANIASLASQDSYSEQQLNELSTRLNRVIAAATSHADAQQDAVP